ncbi:hypothetical protein C5C03_09190 [Clavibacter michiganensis]|uniref:hypothetical protein n=1 Tax=Clavibacter michiganensis TaxID=28447 RepID=UPI000CE89961|nr:hypothetical protein [Clavibacter michiganensis]PPF87749.1 hypothetical protein C5C03_09190 [Clavibacter michiganensis]PPF95030.1 hypothetical protein C5C05_09675 [Clavibacter michiganensis]
MTDAARATARPRIRPSAEPPTRHIEVVATRGQRRARPRTVYAVIVVGGLFAVLLAQLLLSIGLSDGAYAIQSLQQQQKELDRTHQSLTEDVDRLSSPQNLARNAQALGMVASASPSFLSLDGTIQGTPQAKDGATTALTADTLIGNSLLSGVPLTIESDPTKRAAALQAATAQDGTAAVDPGSAIPGSAEASGGVTAGTPSAPPASGAAPGLASATSIPTPQTR